ERVLEDSDGIEWTKWFTGGEINLAHNCVDKWAERTPDATAILWEGEDGAVREVSYVELRRMSDALALRLEELGVAGGDTIGVFMPMAPEAVAAMFACAKLGAIFIPIFSGYAADAAATRLQDAKAKVLVTAEGFLRRGARVPMKEIADEAADAAPSVEHVVVWRRFGDDDVPWNDDRDVEWPKQIDEPFDTAALDP